MVDCALFSQQQFQSHQRDRHGKDAEPLFGQLEKEERYMAFGNDTTAGITNEYQVTAGKGLPKVTVNAFTT